MADSLDPLHDCDAWSENKTLNMPQVLHNVHLVQFLSVRYNLSLIGNE